MSTLRERPVYTWCFCYVTVTVQKMSRRFLFFVPTSVEPGFHYPSSRPEFTGRVVQKCTRVDGPSWRPVNSGAFFDTRQLGQWKPTLTLKRLYGDASWQNSNFLNERAAVTSFILLSHSIASNSTLNETCPKHVLLVNHKRAGCLACVWT